jgi:hypothetical protein
MLAVWKKEEAKVWLHCFCLLIILIHDAVVAGSSWGPEVKKSSWRVDVITKSKKNAELNEPAALFELEVQKEPMVEVRLGKCYGQVFKSLRLFHSCLYSIVFISDCSENCI